MKIVDSVFETRESADADESSSVSFAELGLGDELLEGLEEAGFDEPKEIQINTIPATLEGADLIGQARTGSGKTAAFVLPALQMLEYNKTVEVLVLTPTRELAQQVSQEFFKLGKFTKAKVACVVGGQSYERQIEVVNRGAQVVVATPGRLVDHLKSGVLKNFKPKLVVLDEADEMLDMGFVDDMTTILKAVPKGRQTLLFSATMPRSILGFANKVLTDPKQFTMKDQADNHQDIEQTLFVVGERDRELALSRLIEAEKPNKSIVFCRTRADVDRLCTRLSGLGHKARAIHGDLSQNLRSQVMQDMKKGFIQILIATDVASRGLDISDLSHVFNFHIPDNKERYIHRIGRTGRGGETGKAMTIATPSEIMGHTLFKQRPPSKFILGSVPKRSQLEELNTAVQMAQVTSTDISETAEEIGKSLLKGEEGSFELLCKFISYLQAGKEIKGPESFGLSPDEIKQLSSRSERGSRGRSAGRNSGRSRWGGGGYRDSNRGAGYGRRRFSGTSQRSARR